MIEEKIDKLTAAIEANTAALLAQQITTVASVAPVAAVAPAAIAPVAAVAPVVGNEPLAVVPTAEPVAAGATVALELDKTGVPWDDRIHSTPKKLTTKGIWGRRRNLTDEQFNTVHAELLATMPVAVVPGASNGVAEAPVAAVAPVAQATASTVSAPIAVAPAAAVGAPVAEIAPAPPEIPKIPQIFPEPVNQAVPTKAECENIMAFFQAYHGNQVCTEILTGWNMTTMEQLAAEHYCTWVEWTRNEDLRLRG